MESDKNISSIVGGFYMEDLLHFNVAQEIEIVQQTEHAVYEM